MLYERVAKNIAKKIGTKFAPPQQPYNMALMGAALTFQHAKGRSLAQGNHSDSQLCMPLLPLRIERRVSAVGWNKTICYPRDQVPDQINMGV